MRIVRSTVVQLPQRPCMLRQRIEDGRSWNSGRYWASKRVAISCRRSSVRRCWASRRSTRAIISGINSRSARREVRSGMWISITPLLRNAVTPRFRRVERTTRNSGRDGSRTAFLRARMGVIVGTEAKIASSPEKKLS